MSDTQPQAPKPALDDDTLAFAVRVFGYARGGYTRELAELLGMGLPPNLRNEKGDSLLMLASYHGHAETVRVLLDHGGDPELANDRGQTPLAAAAFKGDADVVRLLLERGAEIDARDQDSGATPLYNAASWGKLDVARLLVEKGADVNARNKSGKTPLAAAEENGFTEVAAFLRAHGAK